VPVNSEWAGDSERFIGRWLKDRGCRDEFIIATKVRRSSKLPAPSVQALGLLCSGGACSSHP
jgi:aryl-alcohol dehydrogenase-like predicted oxidoreductase